MSDGLLARLTREGDRPPETPETRRRRRQGVAVTGVVGFVLLGLALTFEPGSGGFYAATIATAVSWVVGGLLSGPLHLGRRRFLPPVVLAVVAFAGFAVGAYVAFSIPPLRAALGSILSYADDASLGLVLGVAILSGIAEEVYFRGALFSALGRHDPVIWSTVAYMVATVATRNVALVLAAGAMGLLFAVQRKVSGGILAPMLTHVVWSVLMILFLPRP